MYKRTKEREENEYMKKEGKVDKIEDFTKLTHKKRYIFNCVNCNYNSDNNTCSSSYFNNSKKQPSK